MNKKKQGRPEGAVTKYSTAFALRITNKALHDALKKESKTWGVSINHVINKTLTDKFVILK